jgi:flagellar basal-body rod modification protein FlgD
MDTSALSGALGSSGATGSTPSRFSELTSEDFVKIMFTELSNQDPLKPNDSNTLLQQFSSLRSIEADLSLQNKLTAVVSQTEFATAGGLLGKYVTGYNEYFEPVEGRVRGISQTSDGTILTLSNGARVPFKNIDQIIDLPNTTPNTNPPGTPTPPTTPPTPRGPAPNPVPATPPTTPVTPNGNNPQT